MVGRSSWKSGARAKWDWSLREFYDCTCPASPTRPTQQWVNQCCNASVELWERNEKVVHLYTGCEEEREYKRI